MAIQLAESTRNARLEAIETDLGTSAILRIRTGAQPANVAAADSGAVVIAYNLASDWAAAAASGAKALNNLPLTGSATGANTDGAAMHFRLYTSGGVCKMQGSVAETGADLAVDNDAIAIGQTVSVTALTLTDANA